MGKTALVVTVKVDGVAEALAAFKYLPKDAAKRLRTETVKLVEDLAARARADGMADASPQSRLVATTVKAERDRVPVISAGGTKRLGHNRAPAYKLLFGSIFGSNAYRQFHRPHAGRNAYWFFPIVEEEFPRIAGAWKNVVDGIVRDFSEGAG